MLLLSQERPGIFHMTIMSLVLDRYGVGIFKEEQKRYEIDFFQYKAAVEFGIGNSPRAVEVAVSLLRMCKRAELVIDDKLIAAEYVYNHRYGGNECHWVPGASLADLSDVTAVKLQLLLSD